MEKRLKKTGMTLIGAAVSLIGTTYVSAHILDERPGLGARMTIILSVIWIAVVIGIIIIVLRLMRPRNGANNDRGREENHGEKD